jgi:hypothetical protein
MNALVTRLAAFALSATAAIAQKTHDRDHSKMPISDPQMKGAVHAKPVLNSIRDGSANVRRFPVSKKSAARHENERTVRAPSAQWCRTGGGAAMIPTLAGGSRTLSTRQAAKGLPIRLRYRGKSAPAPSGRTCSTARGRPARVQMLFFILRKMPG